MARGPLLFRSSFPVEILQVLTGRDLVKVPDRCSAAGGGYNHTRALEICQQAHDMGLTSRDWGAEYTGRARKTDNRTFCTSTRLPAGRSAGPGKRPGSQRPAHHIAGTQEAARAGPPWVTRPGTRPG